MKKLLLSSLLLTQLLFCNEEPRYRFSGKQALSHLAETSECYKCDLSKQDLRAALAAARKNKPEKQIELMNSNLTRAHLTKANLSRANLSGANLSGATLSGAYLSGADLWRAYLSGADLSKAYLYRANLSEANLTGADLYRATLSEADLSGARLWRANLSEANLSGAQHVDRAILKDANTTNAKIDKIYHKKLSWYQWIVLASSQQ